MALRRVGDYTITRELGHGGMGQVYEALSPQGAVVALKTVAWPETMDPRSRWNAIERFQREARAARSLSHPNVCQVLDFGADEHTFFIVMEFLDGDTVRQIIDLAGKIELGRAVQIVRSVGEALAHAHDQGVVHRDVKPGNIMVLRDGRVKLTDFGVASVVREGGVTRSSETVGTLLYMSPEQVRGARADARSDVFSLGATFYEMITGTPAFEADTPAAVVQRILTKDPPLSGALPSHVSRTLAQCLRKRPQQRFQSAREMVASLTQEAAEFYPTPLLPKAGQGLGPRARVARMPRAWRLGLAAATAVLIAGAVAIPLRGMLQRGRSRLGEVAVSEPRYPPSLKPLAQGLVATYVYGHAGRVGGIAPRPDGSLLVTSRSANPVPPGIYVARAGDECDPTDAYTAPGKPFQTPGGIVRAADGRVLVADPGANAVWAISAPGAAPGVLTDQIPGPTDVAIAPSGFAGPTVSPGDVLVCGNSPGGADRFGLYVIDHKTSAVHMLAGPPELKTGLIHVEFGPDGKLYAVEDDANCDGFTILSISPNGAATPMVNNFRPSTLSQPATGPIAINPVTGQVFFAFRATVYRLPAAGGSPEKYAEGGQEITALEFSADGSALFAADAGDDVVAKIAPRAIEGKLLVTGYYEQAPSGPGSEAFCQVMSGGSETKVRAPTGATGVQLSPRGPEVAYLTENDYPGDKPWLKRSHIWRADLDGNGRVNLTESMGVRAINCNPLWSPDGGKIAFIHCDQRPEVEPCKKPSGLAIWVMNADGKGAHPVAGPQAATGLGSQSCPEYWWSGDGRDVLYRYGRQGQVMSVNMDGTNARELGVPSGNISPDGSKIADETTEPGVLDGERGVWRQLYLTDAHGGHSRILLEQFVKDADIARHLRRVAPDRTGPRWQDDVREWIGPRRVKWSPKSDRVAFLAALHFSSAGRSYYCQVEAWMYELSTGILTRLTDDEACEDNLSWVGRNAYGKRS